MSHNLNLIRVTVIRDILMFVYNVTLICGCLTTNSQLQVYIEIVCITLDDRIFPDTSLYIFIYSRRLYKE